MKKSANLPIPVLRALRKLGQDIKNARRRRRIQLEMMAEQTGLSRTTIIKIERGEPTTTLGSYASVLFVLGMTEALGQLMDSSHDSVGRMLEDERLPQRIRITNRKE